MEVDRYAFPRSALDIIEAISEASFVAVDFEFSGVAANAPRATGRVKDTLQERYAQLKAAAEKFTILQAGFCCAKQDDSGAWVLKTYNVPVSPALNEELDLQRDFAFQSGAVQFLVRNGFDFGASFSYGVQYLSREEEAAAIINAEKKNDKSQIQDILLGENDTEAVAFMEQVRSKIKDWLRRRTYMGNHHSSAINSVEINSRIDLAGVKKELSSFDRRLVHQLVRAEFPMLVSIGRGTEMSIRMLNKDREAQHQAARLERARSLVDRHVGLRRLIDALSGQDIGGLGVYESLRNDPAIKSPYSDLEDSSDDDAQYAEQYQRVTKALQSNRPALIGHNIINDLIYMHQAFLGPLPNSVTEFAKSIHAFCPIVIDTKYLVTHDDATMNPASSLAKVDEELALEALELGSMSLSSTTATSREHSAKSAIVIKAAPGFDKYADAQSLHEAGYDAFITARVFIRLAAKLSRDGGGVPTFDDEVWTDYLNRCRVFGTHEAELNLQDSENADRDGGVSLI